MNAFFVTLGVIFFILILAGIYFYITDPLNLRPLIAGSRNSETPAEHIDQTEQISQNGQTSQTEQTNRNSFLSESQQQALETFGINPENIPSEITAEQEACFVAVLGGERVAEIKAGASPTMTEYYRARDCL